MLGNVQNSMLFAYAVPLVLFVAIYLLRRRKRERESALRLVDANQTGMNEPASLHPRIDPNRCLGSAACVRACPEQAIGIIHGKAELVNAAACIGHGACKAACPHDAIELVFGTSRRGMDIPLVKPNFETNVPGLFIAGELGGMGLIRKAVEQGRQAIASVSKRRGGGAPYDVVIIGAGPAGIAASLAAKEKGLRFVTLEQEDSFGGTVYHYPRNKVVMTAPVELPLVGRMKFGEVSKERLLAFWEEVVARTGLEVSFRERMEAVQPQGGGFVVRTSKAEYRTRSVLLAIGRRGTPRKLGVKGEERPKVVYRLIDPQQYRGRRVLVVGGGDSALEAVLACAAAGAGTATLSYRGAAFSRVKPKNREALREAQAAGRVRVLLDSQVLQIGATTATLECAGRTVELANDAVIICAGGILPTPLLKDMGILVETKFGTA